MTTLQYYKHIRSLGSFRAMDAIREARIAAQLDDISKSRKGRPGPMLAHYEVWPDGSAPITLSFMVKVF